MGMVIKAGLTQNSMGATYSTGSVTLCTNVKVHRGPQRHLTHPIDVTHLTHG